MDHIKKEGHIWSRFADEYKLELVGGVIMLLVTALLPLVKAPTEAIWLLGVMSVVLPLAVGTLRAHIATTLSTLTRDWHDTYGRASRLHGAMSGLSGLRLAHAHIILDRAIKDVEHTQAGRIPLDPATYYSCIIDEMRHAPAGSEVYAVNCLNLLRWTEDPRQRRYDIENRAAADRGVSINRICIVDGSVLKDPLAASARSILREQLAHSGIQLRLVFRHHLMDVSDRVRDWVLFKSPERRVYVDFPDSIDETRVTRAELVVDNMATDRYEEDFRVLSSYALPEEQTARLLEGQEVQVQGAAPRTAQPSESGATPADFEEPQSSLAKTPAPIETMTQYTLQRPVVSCKDAAAAKNIPLENELKTLILTTGQTFVALELPGNAQAHLRAIKNALAAQEAFLASDQELSALGLEPGTVCAVREPVWSMTHLITRRLLTLDYVSTNAGTLTHYVKFSPQIFKGARYYLVGDFEAVP